jgi:hypothetical protein
MGMIVVDMGHKRFHLQWSLVHKDKMHERYKITAQANPDKFIIIENNRPFIRELKGLKRRRIDWKQVEGRSISERTLRIIIDHIDKPAQGKARNIPLILPKSVPNAKRNKPGGAGWGERQMEG